jgi:hypothetical protein
MSKHLCITKEVSGTIFKSNPGYTNYSAEAIYAIKNFGKKGMMENKNFTKTLFFLEGKEKGQKGAKFQI